jgi:hypothetical protein
MKSLAQRLKEKEAKEAKAKLKRSSVVKSFNVKIPWCGCPSVVTEGDTIYIKKRAKKLVDLIQSRAAWQFLKEMKDYLDEMEALQKKLEKEREARWAATPAVVPSFVITSTNDTNVPTPAISATPATPPQEQTFAHR